MAINPIRLDEINFDEIYGTSSDAISGNGNTVKVNQKYWGDNGNLTFDDTTGLVMENGVGLGYINPIKHATAAATTPTPVMPVTPAPSTPASVPSISGVGPDPNLSAEIAAMQAQQAQAAQLAQAQAAQQAQALQLAQAQAAQLAQAQAVQAFQSQAAALAAQQMIPPIMTMGANVLLTPEMQQQYNTTSYSTGGFTLSAADKPIVYSIIAAEGGANNPAEAVSIADTMINRARSGKWGSTDIKTLATNKDQYVVYQNGSYLKSSLSPEAIAAVETEFANAAMGGMTTHNYDCFRSNGSTSYGGTIINPGGNRYKRSA